ncbi:MULTISPECIES: DUF6622 family protein [unclassified Bradyrhizobium]|uniref:DUF6622 family protein n=1 Tax=unclassified Bradyrhizobium TaxID=2631580 RepID=UPI0008E66852|nr:MULTISPECIES: DUF6622 family protein [unclassified Bradyrhizobium]MBB4263160.1 hypothetical protein [Bradyrhizobium sp. CIR3A]MBB4381231.1 hypothetical protein [Bradyrhizobium sp. SBR1B]MBB4424229.1 hypothetical protein [Bradyrhizobium sp. CIR48]NYG49687.1 hypothetical protein [Bradyrhizobium sp. IAR9]SFM81866.1 hypothetical protein SAMN05216573_104481 [Bradyrhizobium sp. Rc3b]
MKSWLAIAAHTPLWVWILFAYLVWQGIQSMQPRTTPIWRALILPVVFIVWGMSRIGFGPQGNAWPLIAWIAAALALLPLGVLTPRPFEVDHTTGEIIRQGSAFALIRNLVVFSLQYAVGVISVIDASDRALAIIIGRAISGATAGYFIGSTIALVMAYRRKRTLG